MARNNTRPEISQYVVCPGDAKLTPRGTRLSGQLNVSLQPARCWRIHKAGARPSRKSIYGPTHESLLSLLRLCWTLEEQEGSLSNSLKTWKVTLPWAQKNTRTQTGG